MSQSDHQSPQVDLHADDSDLRKGAIEGPPQDDVAIAQDVLGANEDQTQG